MGADWGLGAGSIALPAQITANGGSGAGHHLRRMEHVGLAVDSVRRSEGKSYGAPLDGKWERERGRGRGQG